MSFEKLSLSVIAVAILCFTGLIAQCSHNVSECKKEAIKNNIKHEDIRTLCNQ